MLAALSWIADGIALIGQFALWAIETGTNAILAAVVAAYSAAVALLPSMSDAPAIGAPSWLSWLNWFFPVGDLLGILAGAVAMWVTFLAVRYVLRLVRAL